MLWKTLIRKQCLKIQEKNKTKQKPQNIKTSCALVPLKKQKDTFSMEKIKIKDRLPVP